MLTRELMSADVRAVTPRDTVADAARAMREAEVGMLPVVDTRETMRLVGVITDRDIATRCVAERHAATCLVRDHMTDEGIATVSPDATADEVLAAVTIHRVRRLPVVDAGRVVGVVALADVAARMGPAQHGKLARVLEAVSSHTAAV